MRKQPDQREEVEITVHVDASNAELVKAIVAGLNDPSFKAKLLDFMNASALAKQTGGVPTWRALAPF